MSPEVVDAGPQAIADGLTVELYLRDSITTRGPSGATRIGPDVTRWTSWQPRRRSSSCPGGNPQIPKGEGDGPVQDYIAAMPEWKQDVGRNLDDLITSTVPDVAKAVKWNSPLYGVDGDGWFLSYHCFTKYVKVSFFRGTSLDPVPPGSSKTPETRYLDIYVDDDFDEGQFVSWVKQAIGLPGEKL